MKAYEQIERELSVGRVDRIYSLEACAYYGGGSPLQGYLALFLTYRGLSNSQIGYVSSAISIVAMALQLFISDYCDKNSHIPVKRVVAMLALAAGIGALSMFAIPMPAAMFLVTFVTASAVHKTIEGPINAQIMQLNNAGIQAHFGLSRGLGSLSYATISYLLGRLLETHTPDLLMPVYVGFCAVCIAAALRMPVLPVIVRSTAEEKVPSYWEMLRGNRTLVLFLLAALVTITGKISCFTFFVRIVENVGGGTTELGICMFIQAGIELPMMAASVFILKRFRPDHLVAVSFACEGLRILMLIFVTSIGGLYLVMFFCLFCMGLYGVSSVVFVNSIVGDREMVRAQSLLALCNSFGTVISSLYAGVLLDLLGLNAMLWVSSAICFLGLVLMLICSRRYSRQIRADA